MFPIKAETKVFMAEVAIVDAIIPMLLGNNILEPLGAQINLFATGDGVLKLRENEIKMRKTSGGHYTIKVYDLINIYEEHETDSRVFNTEGSIQAQPM